MGFKNHKKEAIRRCRSMHATTIQPSPDKPLALVSAKLGMVPEKYTGRCIAGDGLGHPVRSQPSVGLQDRRPASADIIWVIPLGAHASTYLLCQCAWTWPALPALVFVQAVVMPVRMRMHGPQLGMPPVRRIGSAALRRADFDAQRRQCREVLHGLARRIAGHRYPHHYYRIDHFCNSSSRRKAGHHLSCPAFCRTRDAGSESVLQNYL